MTDEELARREEQRQRLEAKRQQRIDEKEMLRKSRQINEPVSQGSSQNDPLRTKYEVPVTMPQIKEAKNEDFEMKDSLESDDRARQQNPAAKNIRMKPIIDNRNISTTRRTQQTNDKQSSRSPRRSPIQTAANMTLTPAKMHKNT